MMWIAVLLGFSIGLATGGKLRGLQNFTLRSWWLLPLYLLLDAFFNSTFSQMLHNFPRIAVIALLVIQYTSILALVAVNYRVKGLMVLGLGELLNVLVIFANGGRMPVSPLALQSDTALVQQLSSGLIPHYMLLTDKTNFAFLGDMVLVTFPTKALYSIGDLIISLGLLLFTAQVLHMKPAKTAK